MLDQRIGCGCGQSVIHEDCSGSLYCVLVVLLSTHGSVMTPEACLEAGCFITVIMVVSRDLGLHKVIQTPLVKQANQNVLFAQPSVPSYPRLSQRSSGIGSTSDVDDPTVRRLKLNYFVSEYSTV